MAAATIGVIPIILDDKSLPESTPEPTSEPGLPVTKYPFWTEQLDIQQNQMIKNHIASKIQNVIIFSTNLNNIVKENYAKTRSVEETIDSLRDSGLFHVNTPVPKEVAYFYMIDRKCEYRLYAYDDENINRENAIGTESCDNLVHEKSEDVIFSKNYASTSTFNFVNTFARSLDLDKDGHIDLVLGVAVHWDNVSSEIKNMIFLDDVQYMLKDKSDVIVIDVTQSSFSSLKKQAEKQRVYDEDKDKQLLDPNSIARKYEKNSKDESEQLNGLAVTDNGIDLLKDWSLITRSER